MSEEGGPFATAADHTSSGKIATVRVVTRRDGRQPVRNVHAIATKTAAPTRSTTGPPLEVIWGTGAFARTFATNSR